MSGTSDVIAKIGDVAAEARISSVHVLAWRDLDDPEAGGSEVHAAEVARCWSEAGLDVTIRTSYAVNRPQHGLRDGYRVVRKAGRYLVFPRAVASEMAGRMGHRDALVEIWNGVPFLSPLWARRPRICFLHHVHGDMWHQVLSPDLARFGERLESRWAPPLYRSTEVVTLSPSSKDDIVRRLRLSPDHVHVVPPGIHPRFTPGGTRSEHPLVAVVGRLVPVKRLDAMIGQLVRVKAAVPGLEALLVGEGYERPALERLVRDHGAEGWLHLPGRVGDDDLVALYRRAWAVASTSGHEGWGMTMTEAGACGTPAVVSDIAGHRDAVVDGVTGLLAPTDDAVGDGLVRVLTDAALRQRLGSGAQARAVELTWEATALGAMRVLALDARRARP